MRVRRWGVAAGVGIARLRDGQTDNGQTDNGQQVDEGNFSTRRAGASAADLTPLCHRFTFPV